MHEDWLIGRRNPSHSNPLLKEALVFVASLVISTVTTVAIFTGPQAFVIADAGEDVWWASVRV